MRRTIFTVLMALLLAAALPLPALAEPQASATPSAMGTASPRNWDKLMSDDGALLPGSVEGDSAILLDADTGDVLFEKDANAKRYPASTTKIMTCLVCLMNLPEGQDPSDIIVTVGDVPKEDFINGSENIGLKVGEQISLKDLLAGMMVYSGNDAADAIAIHVGGSVEEFADMMNQEAQKLGMTGTHFENPNGLADDTNHYTTAADMARLAREAMKLPLFRELVGYPSYQMQPTDEHPSPSKWRSTDYLLTSDVYGYQYALGIKTGYTNMAQNSFISAAEKEGQTLITAVMHEDVRTRLWTDTITMFEYGFRYFDTMDLMDVLEGRDLSIDVKNAAADDPSQGKLTLEAQAPESHCYTGKRDLIEGLKSDPSQFDVQQTILMDTAPIPKLTDGAPTVVGTVTVSHQGEELMQCNLLATRDVAQTVPGGPSASGAVTPSPSAGAAAKGILRMLPWALLVLLAALAMLVGVRLVIVSRKGGKHRRQPYRTRRR